MKTRHFSRGVLKNVGRGKLYYYCSAENTKTQSVQENIKNISSKYISTKNSTKRSHSIENVYFIIYQFFYLWPIVHVHSRNIVYNCFTTLSLRLLRLAFTYPWCNVLRRAPCPVGILHPESHKEHLEPGPPENEKWTNIEFEEPNKHFR